MDSQQIPPTESFKILVLEDNVEFLQSIGYLLEANGFTNFHLCTTREQMVELLTPDVYIIVIDHTLGQGITGIQVVREVKHINPYTYFIMLSGHKDFDKLLQFNRVSEGQGQYIVKGELNADNLIIQYINKFINTISYFATLKEFASSIKEELSNLHGSYVKKINYHNGDGVAY